MMHDITAEWLEDQHEQQLDPSDTMKLPEDTFIEFEYED
jgi:hypothetical protein